MKKFKGNGLAFFIMGAFFFVVGVTAAIYIKTSTDRFMETAVRVKAEIVDIEISYTKDGDGGKKKVYDSFVRFTTEDKEVVNTMLKHFGYGMNEGDWIELYYDPKNPENVMLERSWDEIFINFTFIIIGLFIMGVGVRQLKIKGKAINKP